MNSLQPLTRAVSSSRSVGLSPAVRSRCHPNTAIRPPRGNSGVTTSRRSASTSSQTVKPTHTPKTAVTESNAPLPKHKTSGMGPPPPRDPSQPLVLYEGPAQYRPLVSHFLAVTFGFIGIATGYNIREHAVWPLLPAAGQTQDLMDWKWRYGLGTAATCAGLMTGGLFKWVASK